MSGDSGCGCGVCRVQGGSETLLHQTSDTRNLYEPSLICSELLRNRPLNGFYSTDPSGNLCLMSLFVTTLLCQVGGLRKEKKTDVHESSLLSLLYRGEGEVDLGLPERECGADSTKHKLHMKLCFTT